MYEFKEALIRIVQGNKIQMGKPIQSPTDAAKAVRDIIKDLDRECLIVVNLSGSNRPINYHIVSVGSSNTCLFGIPNIFKTAMLSNASGIMLIHNHPSGDLEPSAYDLDATEKVYNASKLLDIPLIDHVILGPAEGQIWSIKASNPELFEQTMKNWEDIVA